MMIPKKMNEMYRKLKSVPAGKKKTAKSKIQAKKAQQPLVAKAEQKKHIYTSARPGQTKRRTCCGR